MTFSIVALDAATGDLGVAVQSKFLAVGAVVPWARAGIGAVATQAYANTDFGPTGLRLLTDGLPAAAAMGRLLADDPGREDRQVGMVDAKGGSGSHTGPLCFAWAGGRAGSGFAAQGNILAGPEVVDALAETFLAGGRPFPELLVDCLAAADAAGGDRRGRESAALLVVREGGGYGGRNDRWIDLRVDHDDDPIGRLEGLLSLQRLYFDRPTVADLVELDEGTAQEVGSILGSLGAGPGGRFESVYAPMSGPMTAPEPRPWTGEPRPYPSNWDEAWQRALDAWMSVENLEERTAAPGWIDRRVLEVLRARKSG
jgi:uncharacterized Ntn-hydrolase superfamily protein